MPQRRRYQEGDDNPLDVDPLPPPPDAANRIPPIGVPDDWRTPTPASSYPGGFSAREGGTAGGFDQQMERGPLYYEGDELLPSQWSPDKVLDLQRQLIAAGLIDPGSRIRLGIMDDETINGYYQLLAQANRYGTNWMGALDRLQSGRGLPGGGTMGQDVEVDEHGNIVGIGGADEQLPTRTTNPADLARVFRGVSIEETGIGFGEDEINRMVQAYNAAEISAQRAAFEAEGTTRNVVSPPSPEAFAEDYAIEEHPEQVEEENFLGAMNDFGALLGGWSGS